LFSFSAQSRPPGVIVARKPPVFNGPDLREGYRESGGLTKAQ
jgi:hypothetical protein